MNTEDQAAKGLPEQPAAALLFQAPQFRAPKSDPPRNEEQPAPERSAVSDKKERTPEKGGKGKAKGKAKGKVKESRKDKAPSSEKSQQRSSGPNKEHNGNQRRQEGGSPEKSDKQPDKDQGDQQRSSRRRRRRTRPDNQGGDKASKSRSSGPDPSSDQVQGLKGSTRLEAKRMRRREGRRDSRRRQTITEAEFLARRESVDRKMVVRHADGADQIAVLEDDILVEHFVARRTTQSIVGDVYLGKVQNVLPSMEAAFIDIGRGRNAVLYAGEVNWVALGMEGKPRRIELAMRPGDNILVQVTKDPIGHKGARLTSQPTLAGRHLVFVPGSTMLGISRKLPEPERKRLKKLLRDIVPGNAGVIVRTAAEGASAEQLADDVNRLSKQWAAIEAKQKRARKAPVLLRGEPELAVRVVRDQFNEDVKELVVQGKETWDTVHEYVEELSPELLDRMQHWTSNEDVFDALKVRQQLAKAMDRKVWLPSGGTLIIERTEALTVIDVNTGKFVGSGGTLEETVTKNNLEAAEEIVRQLRLRDIGGIIIIDFVDMVLEANRELVMRRLIESLGRDRTRHQVTEITSLGLVQMTRKRVGEGLVEAFSTTCEVCEGRGFIVHDHPVETHGIGSVRSGPGDRPVQVEAGSKGTEGSGSKRDAHKQPAPSSKQTESHVGERKVRSALSAIAAATVPTEGQKDDADETPTVEAGEALEKSIEEPKKALTVEDIKLPEKAPSTQARKKPTRRRAVSTGRLDTSRQNTAEIVRVSGGSPAGADGDQERRLNRGKAEKDEATKESERQSAAEAVRDLLAK